MKRYIDLSVRWTIRRSPPLDDMKLEIHPAPARPGLLAGVARAPEPPHRRPYRLAPAHLSRRDHDRGDLARSGHG